MSEYVPPTAECHEEVTRDGEIELCDRRPVVAIRADLNHGAADDPTVWYPVCKKHARGPLVPLAEYTRQVKAEAWDEGNAVANSGLPRCPICDDRTVSKRMRGDHSEWWHDDDETVICGGSFTEAVWVDLNPYREGQINE